jgi:hypothetical protein
VDPARQPNETKAVFATRIESLLKMLEDDMAPKHSNGLGALRPEAISVLAQAVEPTELPVFAGTDWRSATRRTEEQGGCAVAGFVPKKAFVLCSLNL